MKKYLIISSFLLFLSSICIIGYIVVDAKEEVVLETNYIEYQKEKEVYLTPYGYTMEDANVVVNPYDISPLTALILFETKEEEEITIEITGKDPASTITNTFQKATKHYIPVYGLYPDTENKVILSTKEKKVSYTIKTSKLPNDLLKTPIINDANNITILTNNNYLYALDHNNDVRWYLEGIYKYSPYKLENGNYLIPTPTLNNNSYPIGLMEIDLLGKVYKQYNIENGYYGSIIENNTSYYILSKNLIEVDKQTGYLLNKINLNDEYKDIYYNEQNNTINLTSEKNTLMINLTTKEQIVLNERNIIKANEINTPLYNNSKNYKIINGVAFNITNKTKESSEKIFLIGYKKIDETYKSHNIKITKNEDYLKITGNFNNNKSYLILENFIDKKIYDITDYTIINNKGLKGKYNIYIKIDDTIYKINKYVKF